MKLRGEYEFTEIEREHYRILHEQGEDALRTQISAPHAHYLTERWINAKVLGFNRATGEIRTYAKYAYPTGPKGTGR